MRAHPHTTLLIWHHSTIRRRLSIAVRALAIIAAASCALAAAPAASARSVAGEYTPAALLITDAPVVLEAPAPGADPAPLITAPLITAPVVPTSLLPTPVDSAPPTPAAEAPTATTAAPATAASTPAPPAAAPAPAPRQAAIATAIAAARSKLGTPYAYGAAGPYAFDCSGFTRWVFLQAGIVLDHYSGSQWAATAHISLDELQPGDLVFNWGFGGGAPDHVGLYVGDGMMIHAPNGGGAVRYDSIYWWKGASVAAGRIR